MMIFNLLKRVFQRIAPGLHTWLVPAGQSFSAKTRLKSWLKGTKIYGPLLRMKYWLNTVKGLAGILAFRYALHPRFANPPGNRIQSLEIIMLVVSDLRIDPRVQREAQALVRGGYHVKIIVPDNSNPPLAEVPLDWGPGVEFVLLPWQAASYVMSYPFLLGRMMLDRATQEKPFAFHCHDLTTAVIGLAAARKVGSLCVCDFHEWWSELAEWDHFKQQYV